jgi:hypothetical protein
VIRRCTFYDLFRQMQTQTQTTIGNELKYRFGPRFLKLFLISFNDVSVLQTSAKRVFLCCNGSFIFHVFLGILQLFFLPILLFFYRMIIRLSRYEKSSFLLFHFFFGVCMSRLEELRKTVGQHHDDVD